MRLGMHAHASVNTPPIEMRLVSLYTFLSVLLLVVVLLLLSKLKKKKRQPRKKMENLMDLNIDTLTYLRYHI